jgi:N-acetylmuramoyl-L-alanine amidase
MGWDLIDPATPSFNDVSKNFWAYKYIETAKANGVITGFPDQTFRPNNSTSRAEIAVMTIRAKGYQLITSGSGFNDLPTNYWARNYILTAKEKGIISGYQDGTFRPGNPATRAEAVKLIYGILE